jgi:hypothetical protein
MVTTLWADADASTLRLRLSETSPVLLLLMLSSRLLIAVVMAPGITPATSPASGPSHDQPWERGYWAREATKRIEQGDFTLAARLAFWELLPPEERVLPEPGGDIAGRPS